MLIGLISESHGVTRAYTCGYEENTLDVTEQGEYFRRGRDGLSSSRSIVKEHYYSHNLTPLCIQAMPFQRFVHAPPRPSCMPPTAKPASAII